MDLFFVCDARRFDLTDRDERTPISFPETYQLYFKIIIIINVAREVTSNRDFLNIQCLVLVLVLSSFNPNPNPLLSRRRSWPRPPGTDNAVGCSRRMGLGHAQYVVRRPAGVGLEGTLLEFLLLPHP